jgi:hypothetical protein
MGYAVAYWLRHYAASRKVAGSSPDEVDFLNRPNPSGRTMALGSTQPLTEMSTPGIFKKIKNPGGKVRPARRADNLAAIYEVLAVCLSNVGALTSRNPKGLHGL